MSRRGSHRMLLRQLERHQIPAHDRSDVENGDEDEDEEIEDEEADISALGSNAAGAEARAAVDSVVGGEDDAAVDEEEEQDQDQDQEEQDLFEQVAAANPGILQPIRGQGFGRDDWGDGATFALLQAWGEKCMALNKWHLRLDHWAELAAAVTIRSNSPKTDVQCKNRVDTLKKKFKLERHKQSSLGCASKWPFYRILERLLGMASVAKSSNAATLPPCNASIDCDRGAGAKIAPSSGLFLPIGADAGKIVRNSSSARRSKRQHHRSSSDEQNRDEGNGGALESDDDEQEDDDEGDLLWVLNSKWPKNTKKRGKTTPTTTKRKKRDDLANSPLAGAIAKLGQIFERMEQCKRQQLADLEKIRLQFTKDLELHRMQLLMQTQMELAKIKHSIDMDGHLSA